MQKIINYILNVNLNTFIGYLKVLKKLSKSFRIKAAGESIKNDKLTYFRDDNVSKIYVVPQRNNKSLIIEERSEKHTLENRHIKAETCQRQPGYFLLTGKKK